MVALVWHLRNEKWIPTESVGFLQREPSLICMTDGLFSFLSYQLSKKISGKFSEKLCVNVH